MAEVEPMPPQEIRRLMARKCAAKALDQAEGNERIALQVLGFLIRRGILQATCLRAAS